MANPFQVARRAAGSVALLNVAYRAALSPRVASWGATEEEVRGSLPGDDVLPVGAETTTMGTTIDAPPDKIWPWLVQMGWGRAGWYSHDLLDNAGRPSAERIVPEWQRVSLGDHMPSDPTGRDRVWFTIEGIYPERALILRASIDLRTGRSYDPSRGRPRAYSDSTWTFALRELPGSRTRLLARTRREAAPAWRAAPVALLVGRPGHLLMQTRQFRNLKRRAETAATASTGRLASSPHDGTWTQRPDVAAAAARRLPLSGVGT
jgi:proline iminopeptidase